MPRAHAIPERATDVFCVVDLSGALYLDGLFGTYAFAKQTADTSGMPVEIVRYSIPVTVDGDPCPICQFLIRKKHAEIATKDIAKSHREDC